MRKLSDEEFNATMTPPMRDVTALEFEFIDIWPYVDAIPPADRENESLGEVEYVYRTANDSFDHVLVMTATKNLYLAVVVDLQQRMIHGHHLLDLNALYGQPLPPAP